MTVAVDIDLDGAGLSEDDAEFAVRQLLCEPLDLPDGSVMYNWLESLQFSVRDTP